MDDSEIETVSGPLCEQDAGAVRRLARAAEHVDGVAPLSEQPLLWLQDPDAAVEHLLVRAADDLAGYAQLDLAAPRATSAELVVHPFARQHGVGSALLARARAVAAGRTGVDPQRPLAVWAHGDLPAARRLAASAGLDVVRELLRLTLDLRGHTPTGRALPDGVTVRAFRPGEDEEDWVRVNARAFADHPEQGRVTVPDVRARENEDWFDPEAFFLAHRDGRLVGSIWLKIPAGPDRDDRTGEIYVVGVDPDAQGTGLGSALTRIGLEHLAAAGVSTAELYTDRSNEVAVRTYTAAGFTVADTDVQLA